MTKTTSFKVLPTFLGFLSGIEKLSFLSWTCGEHGSLSFPPKVLCLLFVFEYTSTRKWTSCSNNFPICWFSELCSHLLRVVAIFQIILGFQNYHSWMSSCPLSKEVGAAHGFSLTGAQSRLCHGPPSRSDRLLWQSRWFLILFPSRFILLCIFLVGTAFSLGPADVPFLVKPAGCCSPC